MNNKYVSLARDFSIKLSSSSGILHCIRNGSVYELKPDQIELLQLLDGTKTIRSIEAQYSAESQSKISKFFGQMRGISALKLTDTISPIKLQDKRVPDRRLESVHLEVSGKCNMKCVHCYQAKYTQSGVQISHQKIMELLDCLQKMQVNNVGISGGEPLMMPELGDILEAIEEKGIRISALFSNGLLVTEAFIKMIKEKRSKFPLFISLDSIPGMALTFRGFSKKDSRTVLERTIGNIKKLIANGIDVVINTVVNSENINHLEEMYDLVSKLAVNSWRLGFPKMTMEFKERGDSFNVEWNEIAKKCFLVLQKHLQNGMPFHLQIEYLFREELFLQGLQKLSNKDFVCDYEGRRSECCVKPNGDVVSCAYCSDLPIGNIHRSSLWDIWYSEAMQKIKTIRVGDVKECIGCKLAYLCGTGCRANAYFLHGNFNNAKDDYACKAMKFFMEQVIPLLEKFGVIKSNRLTNIRRKNMR